MNFFERAKYEYQRQSSGVIKLVMINAAVFIVTSVLGLLGFLVSGGNGQFMGLIDYWLGLPADISKLIIRPWSIITNIFIHAGIWHLLGNMLWLYFIGRILEDLLKAKRIFTIFLGGGILGGVLFVALFNLSPAFADFSQKSFLVGASGGVMAIVAATGVFMPNYEIRPFGLFSIKMIWIAGIKVLLDVISIQSGSNPGGSIAHLGGAIFGVLYIQNMRGSWNFPQLKWPDWLRFKRRGYTIVDETKFKKKRPKTGRAKRSPEQEEIDAILDKISQSGYESLSKEEKDILFRASE